MNRTPEPAVTPEELAAELHEVVKERGGTEPRSLAQRERLRMLRSVETEADHPHELAVGDSIRKVLTSACQRLEPESRARAAEALFGLLPTVRHTFLRIRQEKAAALLDQGWDHFRKNYHDDLIQDVADELWRLEQRVVQHHEKQPLGIDRSAAARYRVISKDYHYVISDDDFRSHTYRRVTEIEAIRPGVRQVEHWYQWSGRGEEGLPIVTSPGHRLLARPMKSSSWKYYRIHLGRELRVGERERIDVEQELFDTEYEFECYLNATISDPGIEHVTLLVTLPKQRPPSMVEHLVLASHNPGAAIIQSFAGRYNADDSSIIWTISTVELGRRYEVRWSYSDGYGIYPGNRIG